LIFHLLPFIPEPSDQAIHAGREYLIGRLEKRWHVGLQSYSALPEHYASFQKECAELVYNTCAASY
jgi:hypothetical protein